ncbi:MAG: protein kinase domain-containing protein, partial [Phycisphaerales bacterium]
LALLDAEPIDDSTRSFVIEILGRTREGDSPSIARSSSPPEIHARYRLLARVGEGGFGEVFLGRSMRPPKRLAAVKVLRSGLDGPRILRRFEGEQQALARLSHPSIAGIFESGTTDDGRPFFAMPYVRGQSIVQHCDAARLGVPDRLELFRRVVDAVAHAHRRGVLHRDLKPANILIDSSDSRAQPVVIDFGIAKSLDEPLTERTVTTEAGRAIGTPEYMSPEQADGLPEAADVRSDVYALGVILYELLCGELPIDRETLRRGGTSRIGETIRSTTVPPPSRRVELDRRPPEDSRWIRRGESSAGSLAAALRGNLDAVCLKCLAKAQTDRYANADALLSDLDRAIAGEPVLARRHSWRDTLRSTVRRHRTAVAVGGTAVLALAIGLAGTVAFAVQATRESEARRIEATRAKAFAAFLGGIFSGLDPEQAKGSDLTLLRMLLDDASEDLERKERDPELALSDQLAAELHLTLGIAYLRLQTLDRSEAHLLQAIEGLEARTAPGMAPEPELVEALTELVGLRMTQYRNDECIEAANRLLEVLGWPEDREVIADPTAIRMLASLGKINAGFEGDRLVIANDSDAGLELSRELAAIARERYADDDAVRLRVLQQHGRVLDNSGRKGESIAMLEDVLEQSERVHGRRHPATLQTVLYLTVAYTSGDPRANILIDDWMPDFEATYRPGHPMIANLRLNYAAGLQKQGRHEEAREHLVASRQLFTEAFGEEHAMTIWVENTLLYTLEALALVEEAEAILVDRMDRWSDRDLTDEKRQELEWWPEWFAGWAGRPLR